MTQIDFYTAVADPATFSGKLVATVYRKPQRLFVLLDDEAALARFSARLWAQDDISFLPHCRASDALAEQTPIWLGLDPSEGEGMPVLLNLSSTRPDDPGRFQRILEIIGTDPEAVAQARARYRYYRALGYSIEHHDMQRIRP